jgi:hypothetical protein
MKDNLADGTQIPAVKHRAVELALLDYIKLIYHSKAILNALKCNQYAR